VYRSGKVVYIGENEKGGHFASYEVPELLAGNLRKMFGKGGGAYGVVKGKDGYKSAEAPITSRL
jgi:hypothetical protein